MMDYDTALRRSVLQIACSLLMLLLILVLIVSSVSDIERKRARSLDEKTATIQQYVDVYKAKEKELPVAAPMVQLNQPADVKKLQTVGFDTSMLRPATYRFLFIFSSMVRYDDETIDFFYVTKDGRVLHKTRLTH